MSQNTTSGDPNTKNFQDVQDPKTKNYQEVEDPNTKNYQEFEDPNTKVPKNSENKDVQKVPNEPITITKLGKDSECKHSNTSGKSRNSAWIGQDVEDSTAKNYQDIEDPDTKNYQDDEVFSKSITEPGNGSECKHSISGESRANPAWTGPYQSCFDRFLSRLLCCCRKKKICNRCGQTITKGI